MFSSKSGLADTPTLIIQNSVSQTTVYRPPVALEVCPNAPSEKTEEKIKFKWIAYNTIAENPKVWKWHMAIAFHFSPSTDILWNLLSYPST